MNTDSPQMVVGGTADGRRDAGAASLWLGYAPTGGRISLRHDEMRKRLFVGGHRADELTSLIAFAARDSDLSTLVLDIDGHLSRTVSGYFEHYEYTCFLHDAFQIEEDESTKHGQLIAAAYTSALGLSAEEEAIIGAGLQRLAIEDNRAAPHVLFGALDAVEGFRGFYVEKLKGRIGGLRFLESAENGSLRSTLSLPGSLISFGSALYPQAMELAGAVFLAKLLAMMPRAKKRPDLVIISGAHRIFRSLPKVQHGERLLTELLDAPETFVLSSDHVLGMSPVVQEAFPNKILSSEAWNQGIEGRWKGNTCEPVLPNAFVIFDGHFGHQRTFIARTFESKYTEPRKGPVVVEEPPQSELTRVILEDIAEVQGAHTLIHRRVALSRVRHGGRGEGARQAPGAGPDLARPWRAETRRRSAHDGLPAYRQGQGLSGGDGQLTATVESMPRVQTQCKAIDTLFDGGLATGTISQIYGEKALGKSIISFQTACAAVAAGHSAIVIDTEQSYNSYLTPYWKGSFSNRFGKEIPIVRVSFEKAPKLAGNRKKKEGVTRGQVISAFSNTLDQLGIAYSESHLKSLTDIVSPELRIDMPDLTGPSVLILEVPDAEELLALHGYNARKEVSEGGRVEIRLQSTPVYESVLHDLVLKTDARLLVYDSISAPFKATFPNTQDLPARSASLAMTLTHAQRLCAQFEIAVLVTSHVSIDPIKAWDRRPYGGIILGHEAKFCLELTKGTAKRNADAECINPGDGDHEKSKAFWVARHPAMEEYSKFGISPVDKEGFH